MEWVAVVSGLVAIEYLVLVGLTGAARGRTEIAAPATTGDPHFERWFRVQGNSVEQLVVFYPSLWLFAHFVNAPAAAGLGLIFALGRALFARGYVTDPAKRGPGFAMSFLANGVLALGGTAGAIVSLF